MAATTSMYSLTELFGNKIKPTNERFGLWLLTENLDNNNLVTNIGDINYTNGEQTLKKFKQITDPFCDNIMVVKIIDFIDCEGEPRNGGFKVKQKICGAYNSYLRGKFSKFNLAKHGVKAKLPFLLYTNANTTNGIRQVIDKDLDILKEKYKNPVAIPYKIELADVQLEVLLQELPDLLKQLEKEHYYLLDFDITQDFAGVFNKAEMTDYLMEFWNFCLQGEYKEDYNVIVDNNKTVGKNCLTWINKNSRVKIYNKFICQLTSPGVNRQLGNHIINFLNCPDKRLKETFTSILAKENGITRLEATIYNYVKDFQEKQEFDPLKDCLNLIISNRKYFENSPFYSVPLSKMWTKLTDTLENSCCLVFNSLLQYVYWGNKNTKKLTGLQIKLPEKQEERKKLINYVLSAFSFNYLPVNYIEILEDVENKNNICVTQKCYIKTGETHFSKSNTLFSTISNDINIEELGIIRTRNVIPIVSRKRINITNKLLPYISKEIDPISSVYLLSVKKREQELEEIKTQERKLAYLEKTITLKEKYKNLLEKEQKIKQIEDLKNYFRQQWKELDTTGFYKLFAFVVNDSGKFNFVGALAEKDGIKSVYYIKGYHKNLFININKNRKLLEEEGFIFIPYNNIRHSLDIIYYPIDRPFMELKTNGSTTYNGHTFPKIEKLDTLDIFKNKEDLIYNVEEREQIDNIKMGDIIGTVKLIECKRLEILEEGLELIISNICSKTFRGKERYILKFENNSSCYTSNYWLEKEIQEKQVDLNFKIKIKLDKIKTTPNKHKERLVFVA